MGLDIFFWKVKREEFGYFSKVNFLIPFFESRGYNIENCVPIRIDREDFEDLLERCNKVLSNHDLAKELLPTQDGFFFGNTEYNDWYFEDVKSVKDYVEDKLSELDKQFTEEEIEFEIWY